MKLLFVMLCSFSLLLSEGISQKLIVSTDKNKQYSQESLLKLKVYFIENPKLRELNEDNSLKLELETLGKYTMVVVKPIESLSVKNRLLMELKPIFHDIFALEDMSHKTMYSSSETFMPFKVQINKVQSSIEKIGLAWIALLTLAIVGLLLSIIRRKKLRMFYENQKELDKNQKKIEEEIKKLGKNDV